MVFYMDKNQITQFSRKHLTELLIAIALIAGAFSTWMHYWSGPSLTIWFFTIGSILGIFLSTPIEKGMKWFYGLAAKQGNTMQIVWGAIHIVVGIVLPFVLFGLFGMLAGTAYHYFAGRAMTSGGSSKHRGAA